MSLAISSANPRYFEDASGNLVYLAGYYDHESPQNNLSGNHWATVLSTTSAHSLNLVRLWCRHTTPWTPSPFTPSGAKWDLATTNTAYLAALRSACEDAAAIGAYVIVHFFVGWDVQDSGYGNAFPNCCWHVNNNVNSVNGDWWDANGEGNEMFEIHSGTMGDTIRTLQVDFMHDVVDALNDLDNIIWEVSNELNTQNSNLAYQEWFLAQIQAYEATKPKQHPVGITCRWNAVAGETALLRASTAEWVAPSGLDGYDTAPPVATATKPVVADVDHIWQSLGTITYDWVWKTCVRGNHPLLMDFGRTIDSSAVDALRDTISYMNRLTLASVVPSSSIWTYAQYWNGRQYLLYQPGSGSFIVSLASGNYTIEWFNPATGSVVSTGTQVAVSGGNTLYPPISGPVVCLLERVLLSVNHSGSNFTWNYSHLAGSLPTEFRISYGTEPGVVAGTVSVPYGTSSKLVSEVLPSPGTYFVSISAWNAAYGSFATGTDVYVTTSGLSAPIGNIVLTLTL